MTRDEALSNARTLANALANATDGIILDAALKSRLAAACQFAVLDHHAGIVLLLQHRIPAPALALLRCLYECHIRGAWLFHCATDEQINDYAADECIPRISELISQLESSKAFAGSTISDAHSQNWNAQNGLTHGGIQLAMRHLTSETIEPNFPDEEVVEALGYANAFAGFAAMQVAVAADNLDACDTILNIQLTHQIPTPVQ